MRLWQDPGYWIGNEQALDAGSVMRRPWILDYDSANCAIGAAVDILGERPSFLVLREAFNGVRRFDDMQRRTGLPRQVLSQRLSRLVAEGMLRKVPYQQDGQRSRAE